MMAIRLLPKRLIGQTIQGIRRRMGQTQGDFAESLGVDGGAETVRLWERGEAQPDYPTLARIATMGLVDVLIFHETDGDAGDIPQVTPGEAAELRALLARMEALLGEARQIVERAASRTAVEALEAASRAPLPPAPQEALALRAEVSVEARPRRKATGGASSSTRSASSADGGSPSSSGKRSSGGTRAKKSNTGASGSGSSSTGTRKRSGSKTSGSSAQA